MRSSIFAALLLVSVLPAVAYACSYPEPPSFKAALKQATNVFVFRLDRAEYKRKDLGGGAHMSWVEGKLQPVQNLHGDPTHYKTINFSTFWCGGVNLVVGHHYLIATHASGDTIKLTSADGSILDIDGFYNPYNKGKNLRSALILPVIRAIYGVEELAASYPPRDVAARTVIQPPLSSH